MHISNNNLNLKEVIQIVDGKIPSFFYYNFIANPIEIVINNSKDFSVQFSAEFSVW